MNFKVHSLIPGIEEPTKVISPQGEDGSSSNVDRELREGKASGDDLWSSH